MGAIRALSDFALRVLWLGPGVAFMVPVARDAPGSEQPVSRCSFIARLETFREQTGLNKRRVNHCQLHDYRALKYQVTINWGEGAI